MMQVSMEQNYEKANLGYSKHKRMQLIKIWQQKTMSWHKYSKFQLVLVTDALAAGDLVDQAVLRVPDEAEEKVPILDEAEDPFRTSIQHIARNKLGQSCACFLI